MIAVKIDTSSHERITVAIEIDGKEYKKVNEEKSRKSQVVLPMLTSLLEEHNKSLQDITSIQVATGPGSFTGLRVGIAVANALGVGLGVPINGKQIGELAEAQYEN